MLFCELPSWIITFLAWRICLHSFGQKFFKLSFFLQLVLCSLIDLNLIYRLQRLRQIKSLSEAFDLSRVVDEADMWLDISQGTGLALGEYLIVAKGANILHDVVLNPTCNIWCTKIFLMPDSKLNVQVITELVVLRFNWFWTESNVMLKESNTTKVLGIQL